MYRWMLAVCFSLLSLLVAAEPTPLGPRKDDSHARIVTSASDEALKRLCDQLAQKATVSGADYVAGVDVYGRTVTPAEGPQASTSLPIPPVKIALTKELLASLGLSGLGQVGLADGEAKLELGYLTVEGNKVYYNGQLVQSSEADKIRQQCLSSAEARGTIVTGTGAPASLEPRAKKP